MLQVLHPPTGYVVTHHGGQHWVVDETCLKTLQKLPVSNADALSTQPGARPRTGRTVHFAVDTDIGPVLVRADRRGGLLGRLLGQWHVHIGAEPRPVRELRVSALARDAGVATPAVLAAIWEPAGPLAYRGWVVLRELDGATTLAELWDVVPPGPDRNTALRAAGETVAALHDAGVIHGDLNAGNILMQREGEAWRGWVVDLAGAQPVQTVGLRRRAAELWRLYRSCTKHRAAGAPIAWVAVPHFLRAYCRRASCSAADLERALRTVAPWMRLKWWLSDRLRVSRPASAHTILWKPSL